MTHVRMFKPQFAPLVEAGVKCQTVRPTPKRMPKPGDRISLRMWTGKPYRSPQRTLCEATVTRTRRVEIWPSADIIAIAGMKLDGDEAMNFAKADGFATHWDLFAWFTAEYGPGKFEGTVIMWTPPNVALEARAPHR